MIIMLHICFIQTFSILPSSTNTYLGLSLPLSHSLLIFLNSHSMYEINNQFKVTNLFKKIQTHPLQTVRNSSPYWDQTSPQSFGETQIVAIDISEDFDRILNATLLNLFSKVLPKKIDQPQNCQVLIQRYCAWESKIFSKHLINYIPHHFEIINSRENNILNYIIEYMVNIPFKIRIHNWFMYVQFQN